MIDTSEPKWNPDQQHAINTIMQVAFARIQGTAIADDEWLVSLWKRQAHHYHTDVSAERDLPLSKVISYLYEPEDVRFQVIMDFLSVILDLQPDTQDDKDIEMVYDARERRFLLEVAHLMELMPVDVNMAERALGQQIYFKLQERNRAESDSRRNEMGQSASAAIEDASRRNKAWRWVKMGAGAAAGGAIIALTGGLAAPLVAPLVVGGLTGWKLHRRTRGIEDFGFEQVLDPNIPHIPSLHCTICVSGYLQDDSSLCTTPWEIAFEKSKAYQDIYCVSYEKEALLDLGRAFKSFIRNEAFKYAGKEALKMTALQAFFAAVALPATLLKATDVIDNPWQIASDRSIKAGIVLADVLEQRVQGKRPCTLVGFSVGTLVITECLKELAERGQVGIIDNVVLMGAPISSSNKKLWRAMRSVVSNKFVNCFSPNDWVLATVYRLHSMSTEVAGLSPVTSIPGIENIKVDIEGHSSYSDNVSTILSQVKVFED
ncbi:hypothetical protein BGW37DRAFT_509743 [Umbelopsis sp. PMI_123]|nr:hypothetical protein BGW37DRAFT_509743 [Umbelopsis sp. PMI_123]